MAPITAPRLRSFLYATAPMTAPLAAPTRMPVSVLVNGRFLSPKPGPPSAQPARTTERISATYFMLAPCFKTPLQGFPSAVLRPQQLRAFYERLQLAVGHLARQVLHAAVGRQDHVFGPHVLQRTLRPLDDSLRRFDRHVGEIDHADHDFLVF